MYMDRFWIPVYDGFSAFKTFKEYPKKFLVCLNKNWLTQVNVYCLENSSEPFQTLFYRYKIGVKPSKYLFQWVVPCVVFLCCRASRLKCIKRIVFLPKREPQTFGSSQRRERFPPISYDQPSKLELGKGYLTFCGFTKEMWVHIIEAPKYPWLRQTLWGFLTCNAKICALLVLIVGLYNYGLSEFLAFP